MMLSTSHAETRMEIFTSSAIRSLEGLWPMVKVPFFSDFAIVKSADTGVRFFFPTATGRRCSTYTCHLSIVLNIVKVNIVKTG